MKIIKTYLVFGILLFSGSVYSQSCSPSLLIGIWKIGSPDSLSRMIFKDEKTINIFYKENIVVILRYTLKSIDNECILTMQQTNRDSTSIIFSKVKITNSDHFSLESFKLKNYNSKTGVWEDMILPKGAILNYERLK